MKGVYWPSVLGAVLSLSAICLTAFFAGYNFAEKQYAVTLLNVVLILVQFRYGTTYIEVERPTHNPQ